MVSYDSASFGTGDVIMSFFTYYARFDWAQELVFDAFFHKSIPRYHRTSREAMVILGHYTPNFNIAHTSTVPGLHVLMKEFKTAAEDLSSLGMTWEKFFRGFDRTSNGTRLEAGTVFRNSYQNYVQIDIQYWGRKLSKGKILVGWIESCCLSLVVGKSAFSCCKS